MTALLQRRPRPVTAQVPEDVNRVLLHNIDWQTYQTIADALPERKIRITYDRGDMEIMTVSGIHDRLKSLLAFMVLAIADELQREIACFGSFTHRRKDLARALEPDCCFYVASFSIVKGKRNINLEKDPPPDLGIEVEISRSLMDRLGILQALGVGEVWCVDEQAIRVRVLLNDAYAVVDQSPSFPEVSLKDLHRFLVIGVNEGELAMLKAFRTWFRGSKRKSKRK